jgi:3-hydroxyacyl-CoA dehydrogenase/3a,7a,12a-trihydroxy-5b-cholest-24-enoyl-CoA hydratase
VPPDRAPDKIVEDKTSENQALLYRLSGDWNPLHADPSFAKAFGFTRPILHGLCFFGFATRHVAQAFAPEGNPEFVKSIKVRFASTVLPGQTIVTEMWKDSDTRIVFRCKVKETGEVCISNAAIELWKELPKPKDRSRPTAAPAGAAPVPNSGDIFRAIGTFLQGNAATAEKVKTTFLFKLSGPDASWTIDLSAPPGKVTEGIAGAAACTLEMSDADFMAMATGQADAMKLFSTGKLKITGDMMASQKLGFLKKITPEMVLAETTKRTGGGASAAGAAPVAPAAAAEPTISEVFAVIADHLASNPELAGKVGAVYQWKIGGAPWVLDLKTGSGSIKPGEATADTTLEIAERDFLDMTQGKADAMKLFTTGKLKISGNVMASQKLEFLRKMDPRRAIEVVAKLRGGAAPAAASPGAAPAAAASSAAEPQAGKVFAALTRRLADHPGLEQEVRATVRFDVKDPAMSQTLALGGADPNKVDAVLTISDADLASLASGKATARQLFQHGKLRIDGDVSVGHRLGFLKGLI